MTHLRNTPASHRFFVTSFLRKTFEAKPLKREGGRELLNNHKGQVLDSSCST